MIALTQEQREELTFEVRRFLDENTFLRSTVEQQVYEIALASLMAEPVAEIKYLEDFSLEVVNVADGFNLGRHPVFTAPPVPEIKFPEYKRNGKPLNILAELVWAECIDEIKRLNGLGE